MCVYIYIYFIFFNFIYLFLMRLSPGLLSCQASDSEFLTQPWIHFAKPYC